MPSTVINAFAAAALLALSATATASSSDRPPRSLTVPVLGLRLPLDRMNVEKFPDGLRAACDQIADDELYTGQVWIFGSAKDAASTYYIVTGIFKRRSPDPAEERRLYENWENGLVLTVKGGTCGGDDAAETFEVHDPNAENDGNVPDSILRELARDLAARTVRAFGGPDRLRAEIKNQRIDFDQLPADVQAAFKPYFGRTKSP
jgi:hypothetical protein